MSLRRFLGRICLAVIITSISACVTTPPIDPPEWAVTPPQDDEQTLRFVAQGASRRAAAVAAAFAVIERMSLGSEAALESEPVESLREQIVSELSGQLGAEVAGITVEDRGISRLDGETTHWIHIAFARAEFARLELRLAREVPGGNPGRPLIARAERRIDDGEIVEGLRDYGRAVMETAGTPYAGETLERSQRGTEEALSQLSLEVERDGIEARVGTTFSQPLEVQVRDTARETGVSDMPVSISYPERTGEGIVTRRLYRRSGTDGRVRFTPPAPRVRGAGEVTIALAPFYDLVIPNREPEALSVLAETAAVAQVSLEYRAFSRAAQIPTAVYVVDTDIAGNPTGTMATQRGLLAAFDARGFETGGLPFEPRQFLTLARSDQLSLVRQRFNGEYDRVVLGRASITEFEEGSSVSIEVGGEVRAIDLDTGEELYRATLAQRSRGNSAQSAIAAAFRGLGAKFAADLALSLP